MVSLTALDFPYNKLLARTQLSEIRGSSFLVTGGGGLVGVNMLYFLGNLKSKGQGPSRIVAVTKHKPVDWLRDFCRSTGIEILSSDLTAHDQALDIGTFDFVVHGAGYGQPGKFLENPLKTISLNTTALQILLEKLERRGRLLFLSTSEIYSGCASELHQEDEIGTTNPSHPRGCYIESKRCGEAICNSFNLTETNAISARLSLIYGPGFRADDKRVINQFIFKALNDGKIRMLDAGLAHRTYCYISDGLEMLFNILLRGTQPVYNVAGRSEVTIYELAKIIGGRIGAPVDVPPATTAPEGAPQSVGLSLERYEDEFSPLALVPLDAGIENTISWAADLK